jgi:sec-independent protein translocase protein TatC
MKEVGRDPQLTVLTIQGGFSTYLRVTFLAGLAVSSLWVFYQLWMFVAVGLRRRERRYVVGAVPVSVLLFVLGAAFFLELVAIPAIKFLTWFNVTWLQSAQIITLQDYIDFVIDMMLICGLVFQMPLVVLVLARLHIVTMKGLHYYRRHVIVAIFVFTGIFAPPDPVSQLVMSAPMLVLYEVGVLAAYFMVFRKQPKDGS